MQILDNHARRIGWFALLMIAVISVDSIRNLPINAQYGTSLITFYLIAGLFFFVPLLFITSKLATAYPNTGGSYLWVEAAFGQRWGFVSVWLQWIYNIIWYPTIFAFISTTFAAMLSPALEESKSFILLSSLALFWIMTGISCLGIRAVSWVSVVCAILGTLLPMSLIIGLAAYWLLLGNPSAVDLTWHALIPSRESLLNITFFANILFSLLGIDVIGVHAGDVKNPTKTYPRVLILSGVIILATLILSTLALCVVVSPLKMGLISGLMDGFALFFDRYNISWGVPFIGVAIILGSIGVASSWMIGLARSLHVASFGSSLPPIMQKLNKRHMPYIILILQAVIFTILLCSFLIFPTISASYWMLSAMTAQFALLYYVLLFTAAFKLLRQKGYSPYWLLLPVFAIIVSITGIAAGFVPSRDIVAQNAIWHYEIILCFGAAVFFMPLIYFLKRK